MKIETLLLALSLSCAALAQTQPPRMSRLMVYDVSPDSADEFYAVQQDTADIYKANKAPMPRLAWTSLTGPQRFVMMVPVAGLDRLNEPTWLSKQGEERPRQSRMARLRHASGTSTVKITTAQDGPTWGSAPNAAPAEFAAVTVFSVKPGKVQDFLAVVKESSDAVKKVGKAKAFHVNRVSFGGDGYEFHVVATYASLADIPAGPAATRTAMGEAAYNAYIQKMSAVVNSMTRDIFRYRAEFSYIPAS